jgi:hypothetical protein
MIRRLPLFLLLLAACRTAIPQAELDSESIARLIRWKGPEAILARLYDDPAKWSQFLALVSRGDRDWLQIANQFRRVSDAGAADELTAAVGEALEQSPSNVLRLSLPSFGPAVCGAPDVDDPRYDSLELATQAIEHRRVMVEQVDASDLAEERNLCLAELERSKGTIARFYANTPKKR